MPTTPAGERDAILLQLKKILAEDMDINLQIDEITDDLALLDGGLALDSILLIELITLIESKLDLAFDDADLRVKTFTRLDILAELVSRKLGIRERDVKGSA